MIDHYNLAVPVEEAADLDRLDQGPHSGGQRDTKWKSTLPEINLGLGYYTYCNLKRYRSLSNAASLLRDIKDSGRQICVF